MTDWSTDPELLQLIERLEPLLADLKRLAAEGRPPDLSDAPLIDSYIVSAMPVTVLIGHITGHPHLSGAVSHTSQLVLAAPQEGWARTLSRYYRLGRPGGTGPPN